MANMPKVKARKETATAAVDAKTFPDLALMELNISTNPQTLKKRARVRMRGFNHATQELAPRNDENVTRLTIDDVEAAGDQIPALKTAVDSIAALLEKMASRDSVLQEMKPFQATVTRKTDEIARIDTHIAGANAGATAAQTQIDELQTQIDAKQTEIDAEADADKKAQLQDQKDHLVLTQSRKQIQKDRAVAEAADLETEKTAAQTEIDTANAALAPLQTELAPIETDLGM